LTVYAYSGRVFDGNDFMEEVTAVIDAEQGKIRAVGKIGEVDIPHDAEMIGFENSTLLPGLIDAHMHFFGSKSMSLTDVIAVPETLGALRSVKDLRNLLNSGFTTVREMGSRAGAHLRKAIEEGVLEGPTIFACSKSLAQTGGDDDPVQFPIHISKELAYSYFCDGPWECRRAVRLVVRDGANLVKVYASGSLSQGTRIVRQFTVEELKAIVDEAHAMNLRVAAHAYGEETISNALEAGVDSLEHGIGLTDEICERIKKQGTFYVPTLSVYMGSWVAGNPWREMMVKRHLSTDMELAKKHGLKIVTGTDFSGSLDEPHGQNYKEIVNISKTLGNRGALVAATSEAANCLGLENTGIIRTGSIADLIAVKGDPSKDIEALNPSNVKLVIKHGKVVKKG